MAALKSKIFVAKSISNFLLLPETLAATSSAKLVESVDRSASVQTHKNSMYTIFQLFLSVFTGAICPLHPEYLHVFAVYILSNLWITICPEEFSLCARNFSQ